MMPDLPMPVTMTRPRHCAEQIDGALEPGVEARHERENRGRLGLEHLARERQVSHRRVPPRRFDDRVDGREPAEQRLEQIEPQRVLRVALGARRIVVHLEEHAVDAGRDARRGERLDVLARGRR